eukprot:CAMPEP_0172179230 /NCGR_PEP_ID=MMETSP1050-20130122/16499_1 /TAXON_ID=233186 /ORGANISM="Cryptomonas curvata, Strain CCAP979/52" /LENGTH=199 /DNA_ID=CAMNT_0012852083 /DNA_START=353 /DNA_END=948 /DNA_ORIENTATION=-
MTLVQDSHLACHSLASLESQTLQKIALKSMNKGESSSTDARSQEHSHARQSLLETIRGAPNAPAAGGKTPFLVILTADQARMIYSLRSESTAQTFELRSVAGKSSLVAELYGVSPKTIRDVWNRKTWTQVTRPMWTAEEAEHYEREHMPPDQRAALGHAEPDCKRRGRPPGSKDARPRKRRLKAGGEDDDDDESGPAEP